MTSNIWYHSNYKGSIHPGAVRSQNWMFLVLNACHDFECSFLSHPRDFWYINVFFVEAVVSSIGGTLFTHVLPFSNDPVSGQQWVHKQET